MQRPHAPTWQSFLDEQFAADYWQSLEAFVDQERRQSDVAVYPPEGQVFAALELTPRDQVRVVILGQDPYHGAGQAHGLAFSVLPGVKPPPSLRNMFRELHSDLGITPPRDGCLDAWTRQGVLLLNTVLTVRQAAANSHRKRGWEQFTDGLIRLLGQQPDPLVFVLWGNPAIAKARLIDDSRHAVITSPHPSPLSAHRGFLGSRPYSRTNQLLTAMGQTPIDWRLTRPLEE